MDRKDYIASIYEAADRYGECLLNKNLLFVYLEKPNKIGIMETAFRDYNFMHLTGVTFASEKKMSATKFYQDSIERRLKQKALLFRTDGTTEQKLTILPTMINAYLSAKMLGDYSGGRMSLLTERLAGGIRGSIGFVYDRNYYYPNTVLKGDIRDSIDRPRRVLAVFRKDISSKKYEECTYVAKNVDLSKLKIPEPYSYLSGEVEPGKKNE